MDGNLTIAEIVVRFIGATAGAGASLLMIWPFGIKDGFSRFAFSVIMGAIFAPVTRDYFGWIDSDDRNLAAACFFGFASWWGAGAFIRVLQSDWAVRLIGNGRSRR